MYYKNRMKKVRVWILQVRSTAYNFYEYRCLHTYPYVAPYGYIFHRKQTNIERGIISFYIFYRYNFFLYFKFVYFTDYIQRLKI